MASVNKVTLIGNLGKDPEINFTANNDSVVNLSVATSFKTKDKVTGEPREETEWHRVVCFGKTAEVVGTWGKKGRSVYVEGRLQTRKWTDKDGVERYSTEIVANSVQFLGGKQENAAGGE
jgi:single-strand DNA-binding protein